MNDGLPENVSPGQERRAVRVSLTFEDFRSFITQYASHVSMGGMFIGTRTPLPPGTLCKLDVRLKSGDRLVGGLGEVVWTRDRAQGPERPPGMGVRFRELEDSSRDLVFAIVDRRLVEGGHVFQLEEGGEEKIPDLDELLQRAEEHRKEIEGRASEPEEEGAPVTPPRPATGNAELELEAMLAAVETRRRPAGDLPAEPESQDPMETEDSSQWVEELAPKAELPEHEALPSIRTEAFEALETEPQSSGSLLPDIPDFGEIQEEVQDGRSGDVLPDLGEEPAPWDSEGATSSRAVFDEPEADEPEEHPLEERHLEERHLEEPSPAAASLDDLGESPRDFSEGTEEVDPGEDGQQLLSGLYPEMAEDTEAEGTGGEPQPSMESVLAGPEETASPGEAATLEEPASPQESFAPAEPTPWEMPEPSLPEDSAQTVPEGPADPFEERLEALSGLMPPVESSLPDTAQGVGAADPIGSLVTGETWQGGGSELERVSTGDTTLAMVPEELPPPFEKPAAAPVEERWSGYAGASSSSGSRWLLWLIPLLLALLAGGYYLWQQSRENGSGPVATASTVAPAEVSTGTPEGANAGILAAEPEGAPEEESSGDLLDGSGEPVSGGTALSEEAPVGGTEEDEVQEGPARTGSSETTAAPTPAVPPASEVSTGTAPAEPLPRVETPMTSLDDISWRRVPEGTLVTLKTDGAVRSGAYKYVRINSGEPRLLVRLIGIQSDPKRPAANAATPELRRIRTGFHPKPTGNEVHIVLDLGAADVDAVRVEPQGNELEIWLARVP